MNWSIKDLLTGKDLIALGMKLGPEMGRIFRAVREAQDVGAGENIVFRVTGHGCLFP